MDAVYLFGDSTGDELRHSLRSLSNLAQVDRVVVAGAHPEWLAEDVVRVAPGNHGPGKHHDTWANLSAAVNDPRVSDEFVLMNDDFFVLQPVPVVPVWVHSVLSTTVVRTFDQDKRRDYTIRMLDELGIDGRLSYELHVPMVMHRPTMRALMRRVDEVRRPRDDPPWKRTLYGNFAHPGVGEFHPDVKVRDFDVVPGPADVFVSTSDYTFRKGALSQWLRERFVEPCRWERVTDGDSRRADARRRTADAR